MNKETVLTHLQDKNAWGFGWNAGLMYEFNANNRVGLAYHSKVDIDFEDDNAVSASRTIRGQGSAAGGLTLRLPDY